MMLDAKDTDASLPSGEAEQPESGSERQRPPPRILLIEDESSIRSALRRFFARMGWEVSEAADGKQALDLLLSAADGEADAGQERAGLSGAGHSYDMVLSDVRMPGLNGIQLYERLKAERPDILRKLVFSTGEVSGTETVEQLQELGCPIVHKPFKLSQLKELAEHLAGAGS